jgi:hypothetical protein
MRARLVAIVIVGALGACSVERLPVSESPPPSRSPRVSNSPLPTSTPEPPIVVDGEPVYVDSTIRAASNTVGGVRILIEADRNPMPAGEPTWVTTTLINQGPGVLRWTTDGCQIHVQVQAQMSGVHWGEGIQQQDAALRFKRWASQTIIDLAGPIPLHFMPERNPHPEVGCADVGIPHELGVGKKVVQRHQWLGFVSQWGNRTSEYGLPPAGPAELVASFDFWWRGGDSEQRGPLVAARLPVLIEAGRNAAALSPGQVVDVALSVPRFRTLLEAHPSLQEWDMPIRLQFDSKVQAWEVELRILGGASALVTIGTFGEVRSVEVRD